MTFSAFTALSVLSPGSTSLSTMNWPPSCAKSVAKSRHIVASLPVATESGVSTPLSFSAFSMAVKSSRLLMPVMLPSAPR